MVFLVNRVYFTAPVASLTTELISSTLVKLEVSERFSFRLDI
jgi:hypothetical protein